MQRPGNLAAILWIATYGLGIVGATQLLYQARAAADHLIAAHHERPHQPDLATGGQPLPILGRILAEVVAFDQQLRPKRYLSRAAAFGFPRPPGDVQVLHLPPGPVGDHQLERVEYRHRPRRALLEIVSDCELELSNVDNAVVLGHADHLGE